MLWLPIRPWRGLRSVDSYGAGGFGAPRDAGSRPHLGTDFIALPGDMLYPIFPCHVSYGALAYPHDPALPDLHSLHLDGLDDYNGWKIKVLYVVPDLSLIGSDVRDGDVPLATAEDVRAYYRLKHPDHQGDITPHVHIEVVIPPHPTDVARLLPGNLPMPVRV
jgi:hypothetical protein